jgi:hypothetical protein
MAFEDLDVGDETRRDGDYVSFPHPDSEGTELSAVTISRGVPVKYDGTDLNTLSGDGTDDVTGILTNYDVYGDTGKEKVGPEATVGMGGTFKADLSVWANGSATVAVGSYVDDANDVFVVEAVDAANNIYEVRVR